MENKKLTQEEKDALKATLQKFKFSDYLIDDYGKLIDCKCFFIEHKNFPIIHSIVRKIGSSSFYFCIKEYIDEENHLLYLYVPKYNYLKLTEYI